MTPFEVKESIMGSTEEQRERATCGSVQGHVWYRHGPAIIFGYLTVHAICVKCGTRKA